MRCAAYSYKLRTGGGIPRSHWRLFTFLLDDIIAMRFVFFRVCKSNVNKEYFEIPALTDIHVGLSFSPNASQFIIIENNRDGTINCSQ